MDKYEFKVLADRLKGNLGDWKFKHYFLGLLFLRYVSEEFSECVSKVKQDPKFRYEDEKDEDWNKGPVFEDLVKVKGYFISPSQLFNNLLKNNREDIVGALKKAFDSLETYHKFDELFSDVDLENERLGKTADERNKRVLEIMEEISKLDFKNKHLTLFDRLHGEHISNVEMHTPSEVSELLSWLVIASVRNINKIYDPMCGNGSLILKLFKSLKKEESTNVDVYGQEPSRVTFNLCRLNLLVHGVCPSKLHLYCGNVLENPKIGEFIKFEAAVANPPRFFKWRKSGDDKLSKDLRFIDAGALAPSDNADFAFVLDCLYRLNEDDGVAAIVVSSESLHNAGPEQKIRQYLVENNYIDCVIQLPDGLFSGDNTNISILIVKKSKHEAQTYFIDASKQFDPIKGKNTLTRQNIEWILDKYQIRKDIASSSMLVDNIVVIEKGYDLLVGSYIGQ